MRLGSVLFGVVLLTNCSGRDPAVPWDVVAMAREVSANLEEYEGVAIDPRSVEVLGWFSIERTFVRGAPPTGPPIVDRRRSATALLWARTSSKPGEPEWLLIDAFRDADGEWQRSLSFREYRQAPTVLRPGETGDGTWHGFQRYREPPRSAEVCTFAAVGFLETPALTARAPEHVTISGGLRRRTWMRLTGQGPSCAVSP